MKEPCCFVMETVGRVSLSCQLFKTKVFEIQCLHVCVCVRVCVFACTVLCGSCLF